jgi:hypothetical protein
MRTLIAQLNGPGGFDWAELVIFAIITLFSLAGALVNWLKERAKKNELAEPLEEADYEVVIGPDGEPMLRPVAKPGAAPPPLPPRPVAKPLATPSARPAAPPARPPAPRDMGAPRPRSFPQPPVAQPISPPPRPVSNAPAKPARPARPAKPARPRYETPIVEEEDPHAHRSVSASGKSVFDEEEQVAHRSAARLRWLGKQGTERDALRRAIVLSEILSPPVAMRESHLPH